METPFRESAGALVVAESNEALDLLEADEPAPLETRIISLGADPPKIEDGDPVTTSDLRAEAEALEFKRLGKFSFSPTVFHQRVVDCWVDPLEIVRITMSTRQPGLRPRFRGVEMATMFDDGSVLTSSEDTAFDVLLADARAIYRVGARDLSLHYEKHLEAVAAHAKRGCRPLRVRDLATVIRMAMWERSRLDRKSARVSLLLMLVGVVLIFVFLQFRR